MSHAWSGFGLLLIATVLHSTVVVAKLERSSSGRRSKLFESIALNASLCLLSWIGLISALRIIIAPSRTILPDCGIIESIFSTFVLLTWVASVLLLHRPNGHPNSSDEHKLPLRKYLVVYVAFFVMAFLLSLFLPTFARVVWLRYGNEPDKESPKFEDGMVKVTTDSENDGLSNNALRLGSIALVSAASLVIIITSAVIGSHLGGSVVFWELWLTITGGYYLRREWRFLRH